MIREVFVRAWRGGAVVLLETKDCYMGYCPGVSRANDFLCLINDGSEWGDFPPPGISVWKHPGVGHIRYTISDMDAFSSWAVSEGHMSEEEQQWLLMQTTLMLASDE